MANPTYDELMKQAESEALYNQVVSAPDVKGTNPDVDLLNSVDVGFGLRPENPVGQAAL